MGHNIYGNIQYFDIIQYDIYCDLLQYFYFFFFFFIENVKIELKIQLAVQPLGLLCISHCIDNSVDKPVY